MTGETIRIISHDHLPAVAGGALTVNPTCTLHDGTGPEPSHGPCASIIIIV